MIVLGAYAFGIIVTLVILPLLGNFIASSMPEDKGAGLRHAAWFSAIALAVIQVVAALIAWVRLRSTSYTVTNQRVMIEQGIVAKTVDEIDLRYIDDSLFHQSIGDRILGIGSVTLLSSDKTTPRTTLRSIREPRKVRELIRAEAYKVSQRQIFTRAT
jgi:uncharacterized membrane protein YdbT with pleckstrin-like domain